MSEPETTSHPTRWIEYRAIDDIPSALVNPKRHHRAGIVGSIEQFDFTEPSVLDERTGRLIAGHGRRDALRWMRDANKPAPEGIMTDGSTWLMPVVRGWSSKDDDHAHGAGIAINRHTETGGWDETELVAVLDQLNTRDTTLPGTVGFSADAFDDLRAKIEEINTSTGNAAPIGIENPFTHDPSGPGNGNNVTHGTHGETDRARYELHDQRNIILAYEGARYVWMVERLTELAATHGIESNAAVVLHLVEKTTGNHAPALGESGEGDNRPW